ncbi:MAG TPA: hypothetical protein VLS91_03045, partial [Acidimicrobiales bacterium]|nr:hypothetical protein [Acidimicrobiales bacterium]
MAIKPSPDRTDLESKTREDLQTIAKVKGVDVSARASKSALIEAIMGDVAPAAAPATPATRAVRSRRTVATPTDDFEDLLGEFTETAPSPAPAPSPRRGLDSPGVVSHASRAQSDAESSVAPAPPAEAAPTPAENPRGPRPERQPRDFNEGGRNNRRNRRNRSGRERFGGEAQPNADQPYSGELLEVEGLLDLREDGYGFLRTKGYHPSPMDVYVSINQVRRYHLRKGDMIAGGYRPAASNEKYPALLRVDSV